MNNLETIGTSALSQKREIHKIKATLARQNEKLRVAGYARVSSESDHQLNSFSAQVRYYTKLIESRDIWEFVEVYADEATSGVSTEKREDFNRMIDDCKKGKIDRIITKSTSRFARNTADLISTVRDLKSLGISVFFEKENIDTENLTSENLLTLYALFAQEESLSISKNAKKGNRMKMKNGTYVSSCVPYGYRLVNNQLEICQTEAEIVKEIFAEYLGGKGTNLIAKEFTAQGKVFREGRAKWTSRAINGIIRNERYIGDMLMQKSFNEDVMPYKKRINHGELPKYYVKNTHKSIVSKLEYEIANLLLKERSEARLSNRLLVEYPLSKKIKCSECGTGYRRKLTNNIAYWVCRLHDNDKELCISNRVSEDAIHRAFIRLYNKLASNYKEILLPMLYSLEKLQEMQTRGNLEISTINKQIAQLTEQNHVMNGLLSKGILDSALFISQTDELNHKIRSLKLNKSRLISEQSSDNIIEKTEELIAVFQSGPNRLTAMDETVLRDMVEKITITENSIVEFTLINGLILAERI